MTIYINTIPYDSLAHAAAIDLRKHILFTPYDEVFDDARKTWDKDKTLYGLFDDDALIGVMVAKKSEDGAHLSEILVDYDKRGQGLGKQMLQFMESRLDKGASLTAEGPLSARGFFEKCGFAPKSKYRGPGDRMRLDFEKKVTGKVKNPIPHYEDAQNLPIFYFTTDTKGFEAIPAIRNHFPKEHLFVVDLLRGDNHWLELAKETKRRTAKYSLIAPHLYGNRLFRPLDDFDLPEKCAAESDRVSRSKSVLLIGTADEFSTNSYRAAFESKNSSLSTVELPLEEEDFHGAHHLDADFYTTFAEKIDSLKEIPFDTLTVVDASFSLQADAMEKFLEQTLTRNLTKIDVFDLFVVDLRRDLLKKNLLRHETTPGTLRIFTETPDRARAELKRLHPAEMSAAIDTLR
ncbi:MAG: GNAT family N-acetyltransferase [Peptoniphilus sp.]|nr:GNAT family N-acetyltransferase [Peptoniphilus sp.]MDY3118807.1 GNAT family N-acetyltransferase [Peptoniphilus sp.]